jgi:glycosyltransferase involved in cell wall biosynthesis
MMLRNSDVLIVIPAFNEAESITKVIEQLQIAEFDILIVDDGSTDNTASVAEKNGVPVLQLPFNLGVGGALRAGFQIALDWGYQAVVQVDADGQHPISSINDLINEMNLQDSHLVLGSRFLSSETSMSISRFRRFIMQILARSASKATNTKITDSSSGFRIIRNPLLLEFSQTLSINYLGDTYEALILAGRAGYKVSEIPAPMNNRDLGKSTASSFEAAKFTLKGLCMALLRIHPKFPASSVRPTKLIN